MKKAKKIKEKKRKSEKTEISWNKVGWIIIGFLKKTSASGFEGFGKFDHSGHFLNFYILKCVFVLKWLTNDALS